MTPLAKVTAPSYAELHPPKTVFAPRTTLKQVRGIFTKPYQLDSVTGVTLGLTGDMPLICHHAVATPPALEFMRLAGLSAPSRLHLYGTAAEAVAAARRCIDSGARLAYVFPPLPGVGAPKDLLVSQSTYGRLNDKGRVTAFVDPEFTPTRTVIPKDALEALWDRTPDLPVFAKAAVTGVTGGGLDVRYCHDDASWHAAISWFRDRAHGMNGLVIEEAIDVRTSWCLGLSILDDACRYLGGAIQLFGEPAKQIGSRIDPDRPVPDKAIDIALAIADRARQRGYRGIAGIDVGIDRYANPYVFDLNFRLNASTNQVLLHEPLTGRIGARITQSWQIERAGPLQAILEPLVPFAENGVFVPTRLFDAMTYWEHDPASEAKSVVTGVIAADSVAKIEALAKTMNRAVENRP